MEDKKEPAKEQPKDNGIMSMGSIIRQKQKEQEEREKSGK